ncbi:MAG TPA: glycine cleavage system aminomethyltransferase GcvT [Mycobacteriales bacterium]|nr:glycine cleavage system aminomethyltransferase GcvT [Mycobacteriales bacterium]
MTAAATSEAAVIEGPLADRHRALGAKFADFGGWSMPLSYAGVVEEHTATRTTVGVFDVSHLGKLRVSGPRAVEFVNSCLTNDLDRIGPGQAQYTMCCDDGTGGVVDDLIVYREEKDLFLVPNAANTDAVVRMLCDEKPDDVAVTNVHRYLATIAVQGPKSAEVLAAVNLPSAMDYMAFARVDWRGANGRSAPVVVCRTGYTGEHGYELMPTVDVAGELWDAVLGAAQALGGMPCGLGARDTLRTEMGYPLHGQDLTVATTPVQARLGWAVGWDKPEFWGRDVITREREVGTPRLLWGLRTEERGIPRAHMAVRSLADDDLGEITSGTFSPTLKAGIALAYLSRAVGEGDRVKVDVRGKPLMMQVVKPPFVASRVR